MIEEEIRKLKGMLNGQTLLNGILINELLETKSISANNLLEKIKIARDCAARHEEGFASIPDVFFEQILAVFGEELPNTQKPAWVAKVIKGGKEDEPQSD